MFKRVAVMAYEIRGTFFDSVVNGPVFLPSCKLHTVHFGTIDPRMPQNSKAIRLPVTSKFV